MPEPEERRVTEQRAEPQSELLIARRIRAQALVAERPAAAVAADIHDACEPTFGTTWIRAYRLAHGIALTDVVEQVRAWFEHDGRKPPRFSETLLSAYESAQKRPGPEYLHYLCAVYRANPDDLGYPGRCLCGRSHQMLRTGVGGHRAAEAATVPVPGGHAGLLHPGAYGAHADAGAYAVGAHPYPRYADGAHQAAAHQAGAQQAAAHQAGAQQPAAHQAAHGASGSWADANGTFLAGPGNGESGAAAGHPVNGATPARAPMRGAPSVGTGPATAHAATAHPATAHAVNPVRPGNAAGAAGATGAGATAAGTTAAGTTAAGTTEASAATAATAAGAANPATAAHPATAATAAITASPGGPAAYSATGAGAATAGSTGQGGTPGGTAGTPALAPAAPGGAPDAAAALGAPVTGTPITGTPTTAMGITQTPVDGTPATGMPVTQMPVTQTAVMETSLAGAGTAGDAVASSAAADQDVLRRTLLEVMTGSGVNLDSRFFGAVDGVRRRMDEALLRGSVSATMMDRWEETAAGYGRQYMTVPPLRVLCDVLLDVCEVRQMCEERQQIEFQERLCRVAAQLTALTGMIMIDLGDQRLARSFFRTARIAADETGDRCLRAWVTVREALVPLYYGDPREAVTLARASGDLAGRNACVAKAMAPLVEARALARLAGPGRSTADQARRLIARAHAAFGQLGHDQRCDTAFGYTARQLLFHEGNALAALGAAEAGRVLAEALAQYPAIEHLDRSLISFDQATCKLSAGDVEEALRIGQQTISQLPAGYRPEILFQRARDLGHAAAGKAGRVPAVRMYQQMIVER